MPVLKRSAFNQGGDWVGDAVDQADQWNANRNDRLGEQDYARQQGNQNRDWQTQYALAQLGLQRDDMIGRRQDNALTRQASADALKAQYDYYGKRDTSDFDLRRQELADRLANSEEERGWKHAQRLYQQDLLEEAQGRRKKQRDEEDAWNSQFGGALEGYKPGGQFMGINDVDPEDVAFLKALPRDTTRTAALQLLSQRQSEKRMADTQIAERIGKLEASGDPAAVATAAKLRAANPRAAKFAGDQLTPQERPQRGFADLPSKQDVSADVEAAIQDVIGLLDQESAGYGQIGIGTADETAQGAMALAADRAKRIAAQYGLRPDDVLKRIADAAGLTPGRTYANFLNPATLFGVIDSPREDAAESFRSAAAKRLMEERR